MKTPLYVGSVRSILQLMQESTGHPYYAAEIQRETGLSKPTVSWALTKLSEAGFVSGKPEPPASFMDRPPRTYYELTSHCLAAIRLIPLSSI